MQVFIFSVELICKLLRDWKKYIVQIFAYTIRNHGQNIWDKLQFSCNIAHYKKNLVSIFLFFFFFWKQKKIQFGRKNWAPVYHSMKFWDFPGFLEFCATLNFKLFDNSWGNSDLSYLLVMTAFCFTCGESKAW